MTLMPPPSFVRPSRHSLRNALNFAFATSCARFDFTTTLTYGDGNGNLDATEDRIPEHGLNESMLSTLHDRYNNANS